MTIAARDYQVYEILQELDEVVGHSAKVDFLRTRFNDHTPLHYILMWNYSDSVVSALPEGTPPFNETEQDGPSRQALWGYLQTMVNFVQGPVGARIPNVKREQIFIEMLEALDNEEARTVCLAKDGKLEERFGINLGVVVEAFPTLGIVTTEEIPEPTVEDKAEDMVELAKRKKAQAKELNAEAKALEKEAKELLKSAE